MQFTKAHIIILFLLFISIGTIGQDFNLIQYTERDGLPSNKTYDIGQDSTGLLWIGTENGLVSFDGDEFVTYTHPDLLDNDIIEVAINNNGRVYFLNLSEQLGYIENGEMVFIDTGGKFKRIMNVVTRNDKDYLFTIANKRKTIYEIRETENKKFDFILTDLYYMGVDAESDFSRQEKLKYLRNWDSTIFTIDTNFLGLIFSEKENYVFDAFYKHNIVYPVDQFLYEYIKKEPYQRIVKDNDNYFIINNKGLIYHKSKSERFNPLFEDLIVNTIFFDSENNAWISSKNQGLLMVSNFYQKINFNDSNPASSKGINDIFQDENGIIYLGTTSSELNIIDSDEVIEIKISDNPKAVNISENRDQIYAYNLNATLIRKKNKPNYKIYNKQRLFDQKVLLIEESKIYLGTSHGLFTLNINKYFDSNYGRIPQLHLNIRISSFYKDPNTNIKYAGTIKGLFTIENDTLVSNKNIKLQTANISKITEGGNNTFWLGTRTEGILNIRNDSILKVYNIDNGLVSNNINNLHQHNDELFICTNSGLSIIDLKNDKVRNVNSYNFLSSNNVLVCKVINGKYWIGTIEGLTILTKEEINTLTTSGPKISLKDLMINGVKTRYNSGMILKHTENNVQLNLQNISFKSGNNKKVKYRIPLIDSTWITTADPNLRLPALQPGEYHIEAFGINSIGQQGEPLNIYFKIDLPWWDKLWVKFLGFLVLFGVVYSIILYRARRIRKEEATKRDFLSQINKIKDQALQLQMNPHFIFNSLNAIQGFIGTDEEEKAMNFLARFARLIRLIFEHSKGNTITLEEELEFIHLYLDLEKLRFKDKVDVDVKIDPEIEANKDMINVPPLLIQPIIENSFKHGLFHKQGRGNLAISYLLNDALLKVIVQDNGVGREKAKKIANKNNEKQTSSGIKTTQERLDLLNFGNDGKSNRIDIEDLYNEDGSASGTKTTLVLNINEIHIF